MPVFRAGESAAQCISSALGIPIFSSSHQEGHLESARQSIEFEKSEFYAIHMSGGTSELLWVSKRDDYKIEIIGGSRDISFGQFLDRLGVAMGFQFPAGRYMDEWALKSEDRGLRIPSRVDGLYFNLSGQETMGLKYVKDGYNHEEVALSAMLCVAKTLEKLFVNLFKLDKLPVLITGGVASSTYLRRYLEDRFGGLIYFSKGRYASDNAVGAAFIGYEKFMRDKDSGVNPY
jgi:N6-L-threonylcarbamoyladenine synthase